MKRSPNRAHTTVGTSMHRLGAEYKNLWKEHPPIAYLNYHTTYQKITDFELSRIFHCRVRHNILHHKCFLRFYLELIPNPDFAQELLLEELVQLTFRMIKPRKTSCSLTSDAKITMIRKAKLPL